MLNVDASIDGQALHASAMTTVPNAGLKILEGSSRLGSMVYRQRDFQITHELLQGIDGNYHEPAFHIGTHLAKNVSRQQSWLAFPPRSYC